MNNIIDYAKQAQKAFKNYLKNNEIDYKTCEKIYNYINSIESITPEEKKELDKFINDNYFDTIHLANIYTNNERKKTLKKQFIRMIPISMAKPDGKIYKASGNFTPFINLNNKKQAIKIKTYPKKKV